MNSLIGKYRKDDLPIDLQLALFNTFVMLIMTYGCEIWGYIVDRELEQLQMTYKKQVLYGEYFIDVIINTRMTGY